MLPFTLLTLFIFPIVISGEEVSEIPSADFVFDLPDIVATHETLWGEIQLEAFGARQVKRVAIFWLDILKLHYYTYFNCNFFLNFRC